MPESLLAFADQRQASWSELAALVRRARGRVTRLDAADVRRLGRCYREAVADLAVARRRFPAEPMTAELDALVRNARPLVYGTVTERESVWDFVRTGYWRRICERPRLLLVAAAVMFLPGLAVGVWTNAHPAEAARVAKVSALSSGLGERGVRDPDTQKVTALDRNAAFSSQIFTNNARVALMTFAGGLTGGVLTLALLLFNGLVMGLIFGYGVHLGAGDSLVRLVVPHGVLELSLITVAGAAGLRVGWALVHPGHRTRAEALKVEGRAGVEVALGCAALLVPCGLVEGFVTPRGLSLPAALAVGFLLGGLYWAMVVWRGVPAVRRARADAVRSEPSP